MVPTVMGSLKGIPMKTMQWLPSLAAMIVGSVWLANLTSTKISVAGENNLLRGRITAAKACGGVDPQPSPADPETIDGGRARSGRALAGNLREWKSLADEIQSEGSWSIDNLRLTLRLENRLEKMSAEEILATYHELVASEIPPGSLTELQDRFLRVASEKNPQLTLRHSANLLADGDRAPRGPLSTALGRWLIEEPAAAISWFDEMVATGKLETKRLDGKNAMLVDLAGPVINSLLDSKPEASLAHLLALPENDRLDILRFSFDACNPGTEKTIADLVRKGLPEDQHDLGLSDFTGSLASRQGFSKVSEFFETIHATPSERLAMAGAGAEGGLRHLVESSGGFDRKSVDCMRDWLEREVPEAVDRIYGKALAEYAGDDRLNEVLALVSELHAETGSDDLLRAFLENRWASIHPREAFAMSAKIGDGNIREKIQNQIKPFLSSATGNKP